MMGIAKSKIPTFVLDFCQRWVDMSTSIGSLGLMMRIFSDIFQTFKIDIFHLSRTARDAVRATPDRSSLAERR